ncbi:MFS transporter [Flagellimonas sp. HMM57]|uniref:MFS transporter n=1 Tax=unclassified Flagellimonas TaxID=2644544 RepID=UPI0013D80831|nr:MULTISPECIES: MFS transporter [unclassified Flagellimonas]UII75462.1 MFS transporter [Flagellimonas sp. HMM57]
MQKPPWYYLILLILAGEAVFILPFVLPRIFRPTVLDVFQLENVQLGLCFSVYGIVALLSYLVGGPLADKFPPRKLIAIALWMTALGGILFATYPGYGILRALYGYWGFTTIFLFWAPMIKATRVWGGDTSQGKAFGFLDGGRGLTGALFGLLGVLVFSLFLKEDVNTADLSERKEAFTYVIYMASVIIGVIGVLVWLFMKSGMDESNILIEELSFTDIKKVLKLPSVWLLMIIILCGYVGYKITDVISQYANEVMRYNEVESAKVGTFLQFLRPTTGILVGLVVDRFKITFWLFLSLLLCVIGGIFFGSGVIGPSTTILFFMSVVTIAVGVYAARALYFGVMQEGKIPLVLTGTAVGLISLVGYTPDIFAGPAYGYFLDTYPGEQGHQYVFWMLTGFSGVGAITAFIYYRMYRNN